MKARVLGTLILVLILVGSSWADRRKYTFTYQYYPPTAGESELELYQTTRLSDARWWEYRFEFEHGVTDRWDLAVYQIFSQSENESFHWDAFQIRSIYLLASPGKFVLNPSLYLEYRRELDLSEPNELETKLILGRDFGRANLSLNPVYELKWAPGKPQHEAGLDLGISRELSYALSVGAESLTRFEFGDAGTETTSYFGPVFSFAKGSIYYTVGYYWGVTDESDNARIRFLMGIGL